MHKPAFAILLVFLLLGAGGYIAGDAQQDRRIDFDRQNLQQFFEADSFDNDVALDTYLIPAGEADSSLVNLDLLGLKRDRFAYRARRNGEVFAVAVPASADDGFNGTVDILVSIDMFGRIGAARVVSDISSDELYGVVDVIESSWMENFSDKGMRDILGVSWSKISAEREYDQFVGASLTPKAVSNRIYDTLVFFQSNRIELIRGEG